LISKDGGDISEQEEKEMFEFIKSGKIKFFEYASDLKLDNFLFESCKNCNFKEKVE